MIGAPRCIASSVFRSACSYRVDTAAGPLELHNLPGIARAHALEVGALVLIALAAQQLGLLVIVFRRREQTARNQRLKLGQAPALEVVVEVACGKN